MEPTAMPAWVLQAIVEPRSYIDTVEVQQKPFFRGPFLRCVRANSGSAYGPRVKRMGESRATNVIAIHQPNWEALRAIGGLSSARVTRVAIAVDLLTRSLADAAAVHRWFARHLMQGDSPRSRMRQYKCTTYFDESVENRAGTCLAVYSHRPTKTEGGGPCCHLEWRTSGAQALERAGLREPLDLVQLDLRTFWEKRIKLVAPPSAEAIGAEWLEEFTSPDREGSKRFPWGRTRSPARVGEMILRSEVSDRDGLTYCHDLVYALDRMPGMVGPGLHSSIFPPLD